MAPSRNHIRRAVGGLFRGRALRRLCAFAAALTLGLSLAGCAGAGLTVLGAGAGVAAGTGVSYTLNGIAYKTFTASDDDVHTATLLALRRMAMDIKKDKPTHDGYEVIAKAADREVSVELERLTRRATRMRVSVDKDSIFKDRATAAEIILQASHTLDRKVARRLPG